jgi:hypothetical protein
VLGHEGLVRGDDRGAAAQEASHQRSRRFNGIERVYNDVIVSAKESRLVIREAREFWTSAWLAGISNQRVIDLKANAGIGRGGAVGRKPGNGLADLTQPQ